MKVETYCAKPLDRQQGCLFRSCISKLQLHSLRQRSHRHPMHLPPELNLFNSNYIICFLLKSYCKHSHQDKELHPERTLRTLPILCQSVVEKRQSPVCHRWDHKRSIRENVYHLLWPVHMHNVNILHSLKKYIL